MDILYLVVDGVWSNWGEWDNCTMPCDGGETCRVRSCNNPLPQNGGKNCSGSLEECKECNTVRCKGR